MSGSSRRIAALQAEAAKVNSVHAQQQRWRIEDKLNKQNFHRQQNPLGSGGLTAIPKDLQTPNTRFTRLVNFNAGEDNIGTTISDQVDAQNQASVAAGVTPITVPTDVPTTPNEVLAEGDGGLNPAVTSAQGNPQMTMAIGDQKTAGGINTRTNIQELKLITNDIGGKIGGTFQNAFEQYMSFSMLNKGLDALKQTQTKFDERTQQRHITTNAEVSKLIASTDSDIQHLGGLSAGGFDEEGQAWQFARGV